MADVDSGGGASKHPPPDDNPKTLLNLFLMRYCGRSIFKGDVSYNTEADPSGSGFICTVRLSILAEKEGAAEPMEFVGESSETEKKAELSAARTVLDHYAEWIEANPPEAKEGNKKTKSKKKRKAGDLETEKKEEYDLKFVDDPERIDEDAASRKSLNNQPAWMTHGLGVNEEILGESKGNLVKPGMYEEDLERIEAMKGNPLGDGPDPFGDVFAERNDSASKPIGAPKPSAKISRAALPSQSSAFGGTSLPVSGAPPAKLVPSIRPSAKMAGGAIGKMPSAKKEETKEDTFNAWSLITGLT